MGARFQGARQGAMIVLCIAGMGLALPALAQSDALTPPPDLRTGPLPVPVDGTAIAGENTSPAGEMAIPVPPSTCAGIVAVVHSQGSILIPTGGGNAQRYVLDDAQCAQGQVTKPAWISTFDNPRCFVGYTCGTANNDGGN